MAIDESKLNAFMGNFVHDLGAVMHAATIVVGDQLGLYRALQEGGPATCHRGPLARRRIAATTPAWRRCPPTRARAATCSTRASAAAGRAWSAPCRQGGGHR